MNWAEPWWLVAIALVAALVGIVIGAGWLHRARLRKAFGRTLFEQVLPTSTRVRRGLRDGLALAALALVVIALAEPRFDKEIRTVKASGVDMVLVLDLSLSMGATDVEPSRLERARREISDLFRILQADRVGLVVYAGNAYPLLPLTEDLIAVQSFVDDLDTRTFDAQGSALGAAIQAGIQVLEGSEGASGKAMLILSDGEVHEGDDALAMADVAAEAGVAIYALGIGERASPVPVPGGTLAWDGKEVLTTPDEAVLKELARKTGGAYVKSVASNADVVGIYEGEMRNKLTIVERDSNDREVWRSAFQWPLGLGIVFAVLGAWIGDGRRLLGAAAALTLVVLAVGSPTSALAGPLTEADQLYRDGDFAGAAERLTDLSLKSPTDPAIFDRLGAARYRAGDYEGSARAFDTAARLTGGTDTDALYNAGNAHWKAGRLEQAIERFGRVLESDPAHAKAKGNAEILAQELQARRNAPPPPPPKPKPGEDNEDPGGEGEEEDPNDEPQDGEDESQDDGEGSQDQPKGEEEDPDQPPNDGGKSDPSEGEGEEGDGDSQQPVEGSPSEQTGDTEITAGQAERMLDSVEEGQRRIKVPGKPGGKPW